MQKAKGKSTSQKSKFLIVGLGNPGKQYQNTWHNLGFLAIDGFAKNNDFPDFRLDKKSNSLVSRKENVILAKPQTFMNESGKAVNALFQRYRATIATAELRRQLIVVHDDADLAIGKIRISKGRGHAGHKGVESIINTLKTKNFFRIRIGIRPANYIPGSKSLDRFVLKKFAKTEGKIIDQIIKEAIATLSSLVLSETWHK